MVELLPQSNLQVNTNSSEGRQHATFVMAGDYEKIAELGRISRAMNSSSYGSFTIDARRHQLYRNRALTPRRR